MALKENDDHNAVSSLCDMSHSNTERAECAREELLLSVKANIRRKTPADQPAFCELIQSFEKTDLWYSSACILNPILLSTYAR
jgi:hypothetical protein